MTTFRSGDVVRIKSGAFASLNGRIAGINRARGLLEVAVEIFGRRTPIRLKFSEADKIPFSD